MVFESLVVDLVNRYLGDFIENLDKSQLKIGIWGGRCHCLVSLSPFDFVSDSFTHTHKISPVHLTTAYR